MSYFGVRVKNIDYDVTTKIHGPLDCFAIDPDLLRTFIKNKVMQYFELHIEEAAVSLANDIVNEYCDGHKLVWVEVTIDYPNGDVFSISAEKVDDHVKT